MSILNNNHWTLATYRQRMTTKQWREVLLDNGGTIIYRGTICKLKVKNLGAGVVEVYKDIPINKEPDAEKGGDERCRTLEKS